MTHTNLLNDIFTHTSNISGLPDIFYPNAKQTDIPDDYLEIFLLPAKPDDIGLTEISHSKGIIQINVNTPVNKGVIYQAGIIDLILEAFKRNTIIENIRIDKTPYVSQSVAMDAKYKTPISIEYNYLTV